MFSPTARLPRKLVNKIQSLDFVEMSELLPEAWIPDADESTSSIHGRQQDVGGLWTYALSPAVLTSSCSDLTEC